MKETGVYIVLDLDHFSECLVCLSIASTEHIKEGRIP